MNRLLSSISYSLSRNGILVLQESDRFQKIVCEGYKKLNVVKANDRAIIDIFVSYNPIKGTCRRLVLDPTNPSRYAFIDLYYWSIANLGSLLWLFFENIDILEAPLKTMYILLASKPRKTILPKYLDNLEPLYSTLSNNS